MEKKKKKRRWLRRGGLLLVLALLLSALFGPFGLGNFGDRLLSLFQSPQEPASVPSLSNPVTDPSAPVSSDRSGDQIRVQETQLYWNDAPVDLDALKTHLDTVDRSLVLRLKDDKANNSLFEQVEGLLKSLEIKYILE